MLTAVTALAALVGIMLQASSEPPRQTFRSAANLVTIQASVRDQRGRPVDGLKASDFEVRDNNEPRPVVSVRSDRRSPVTLAILVDMSGSMSVRPKIAMARRTFDMLLTQLREADEVALFTFDSELRQRHQFTNSIAQLRGTLNEFEAFGSTSLYDAAADTARQISRRSGAHKAIVILTDGSDTSSTLTAPEVSRLASSIDVPVFIVATVPSLDRAAILETSRRPLSSVGADLRELAGWTGGLLVFANTVDETEAVARMLVDELRHQYVLAIEAAPTVEWRRLEVRVKHPSPVVVKARSGYFGGQ